MGRKSVNPNKSYYQQAREECGLTRLAASVSLEYLSDAKLAKLENGLVRIQPDDVVAMSQTYHKPEMRNYYCTHECAIGNIDKTEIMQADLPQITIEMVNTLSSLETTKQRLLEIAGDGKITPDEYYDFCKIREQLSKIAMSVDSLQLWLEKAVIEGKIPENLI